MNVKFHLLSLKFSIILILILFILIWILFHLLNFYVPLKRQTEEPLPGNNFFYKNFLDLHVF